MHQIDCPTDRGVRQAVQHGESMACIYLGLRPGFHRIATFASWGVAWSIGIGCRCTLVKIVITRQPLPFQTASLSTRSIALLSRPVDHMRGCCRFFKPVDTKHSTGCLHCSCSIMVRNNDHCKSPVVTVPYVHRPRLWVRGADRARLGLVGTFAIITYAYCSLRAV